MNIGSSRVVLRQRGIMEVLDLAARFLVEERRPFLILTAIVLVPPCVFALVLALAFDAWAAAACVAVGAMTLLDLPFMLLASRLVFDAKAPLSRVLLDSAKALPKLLVARTLQGIGVVLGFAMGGLPSIWLAVVLLFLPEVIALEQTSIFRSFTRCGRLLSGHFGTALVAFIWLTGLHVGAVLLFDFAGRAVLRDVLQIVPPPALFDAKKSALALAGFFAAIPFLAVTRLLVYLDIRTRAEGWDVQARFVAIAQRGLGTQP